MCKKLLCLFLAMLMLLASVPAFAEDDLIIDDEFEEIDDFEDEQEGEDLPVDIGSLTEYDYEHITVGNPTPLNGQFFTAMWGNSTSDIDVRKLVSAYSMISWDTSISQFRFDHSVVSGAVVLGEQDGARTYYISLYSDLFYSDGTPITAWDYAFSVLLTGSPLIAELGGVPERYDFLEGFEDSAEGAVATAVYEGTRPLLLEIQALTGPSGIGFARRTGIGVEANRLNMILAVLERKAGISLLSRDVYVNVVGGLKPEGTSTDLAVALAIWSAEKGAFIPHDTLIIGEIGLTGDLRPVMQAEKLCKEASRMGFARIILPKRNLARVKDAPEGLQLVGVTTVREALEASQKVRE